MESVHIYAMPVRVQPGDKPIVLSEFGGYRLEGPGPQLQSLRDLQLQPLPHAGGVPACAGGPVPQGGPARAGRRLCAAIYTQLSDVEDEVNGLVTYDRALCKADEARMREIAELLQF